MLAIIQTRTTSAKRPNWPADGWWSLCERLVNRPLLNEAVAPRDWDILPWARLAPELENAVAMNSPSTACQLAPVNQRIFGHLVSTLAVGLREFLIKRALSLHPPSDLC